MMATCFKSKIRAYVWIGLFPFFTINFVHVCCAQSGETGGTGVITDNPPSITCPGNTTIAANASCLNAIGNFTPLVLNDDFDTNPTVTQNPSASFVLVGHTSTTTVVLTAFDNVGQSSTCSFVVTLEDNTAPQIGCPNNLTLAANANCTRQLGSYVPTALSDNCNPSPTVLQSPASNTMLVLNTAQTVTLTASDGNGNSGNCTFSVLLKDIAPPVVACLEIEAILDNNGVVSIMPEQTLDAAASHDNCGNVVAQSLTQSAFNCDHIGLNSIILTAHDGHGNTATCFANVLVVNNTPPVAACRNITVYLGSGGTVGIAPEQVFDPAASGDNCGTVVVPQSVEPQAFTCANIGPNTVVLTAFDGKEGIATCSANVTVVDNTPPAVACLNLTLPLDGNGVTNLTAAQLLNTGASADNCGAVIPQGLSTSQFTCSDVGSHVVTLTVHDGHGNTASCDATVVVEDKTRPTLTCPANIIRSTDAGQCGAVVVYATPAGADNCGVPLVSLQSAPSTASGNLFVLGITTVQWNAADGAGLATNCTFTITVTDSQVPGIVCPGNQAVGTDPGQCHAVFTFTLPNATDNCALPTNSVQQTAGPASGQTFPKGINTLVFKATDAAGLTKSCSFRVTVSDTQKPFISCPANQTTVAPAGMCQATVNYPLPTAVDNCAPAPTVVRIGGPPSGTSVLVGTIGVVWRAVDGAGRSSTCSFTLTVVDNTPPTIACPPNIVQTNPANACIAPIVYATPVAADNCGVNALFLESGLASGSVFPVGTTTMTWRAVDVAGLSTTCSFSVTVSCGTYRPFGDVAYRSPDLHTSAPNGVQRYVLSPNPATEAVDIAWEGPAPDQVAVFDAQGRLVWEQAMDTSAQTLHLDVSGWVSGVYMVALRAEGIVVTKRLSVSPIPDRRF